MRAGRRRAGPVGYRRALPCRKDGADDVLLEFYLPSRALVDAKYRELTEAGYGSYRAPFEVPRIGMYFALVEDPDGHTILLSGDLAEAPPPA